MDYEMINNLLEFKMQDSDRDNFFLNVFPSLDAFSKAQVLDIIKNKMTLFDYYINGSEKKDIILNNIKNSINDFLAEDDIYKCIELFPIIEFYNGLNYDFIDNDVILSSFEKMCYIADNTNIFHNEHFNEIIINTIKKVAYTYSYSDIFDAIKESSNYKYFISLLCNYVRFSNKEKMLEDEAINIIIDIKDILDSPELIDIFYNKFEQDIDLEKYSNYIDNLIPLDDKREQFFVDIEKYRIKYGILPEKICLYVNCFYGWNDNILRICNIDLLKNHLHNSGIDDVSIYYDKNIPNRNLGLASEKVLAIKKIKLSYVMFHEARHIIQFNNTENDKNYYNYNYNILKDTILANYGDSRTYNRNHNRYMFEIDADIQGLRDYYDYLEKMKMMTDIDKEKRDSINENEQKRLYYANYINIDGNNYIKGYIFDEILSENADLIDEYPVLNIEYDKNGKRKSNLDILKSLEEELISAKRTEAEIYGISYCIFDNYYEEINIEETINDLKKFETDNNIMNEIKNGLIDYLSNYGDKEIDNPKTIKQE